MEAINKELSEKAIEKSVEFDVDNVIDPPKDVKPKKPRSQAQKEAFEKARKKRAENLKKKKEEEEGVSKTESAVSEDDHETHDQSNLKEVSDSKKEIVKKPRGRPRGAKNKKVMKREPEPTNDRPNYPSRSAGDYPVYEPRDHGHRYQGQQYQSPYPPMAYQPPPQIHNYYYGHQQGAVSQGHQAQTAPPNFEP
mgnify:FL=1